MLVLRAITRGSCHVSTGFSRKICTTGILTEAENFHDKDELTDYDNMFIDTDVPSPCWSKGFLTQYENYKKLELEGIWKRLSSPFDSRRTNRVFVKALPPTGKMFEYAVFLNKDENLMHAIIQFGPWLEGHHGFIHSGAIATVLDSAMGKHLAAVGYAPGTVNLNIDFKRPVPIGAVLIAENRIVGQEGVRLFCSTVLRSIEGDTIYDTGRGIFLNYNKLPRRRRIVNREL